MSSSDWITTSNFIWFWFEGGIFFWIQLCYKIFLLFSPFTSLLPIICTFLCSLPTISGHSVYFSRPVLAVDSLETGWLPLTFGLGVIGSQSQCRALLHCQVSAAEVTKLNQSAAAMGEQKLRVNDEKLQTKHKKAKHCKLGKNKQMEKKSYEWKAQNKNKPNTRETLWWL